MEIAESAERASTPISAKTIARWDRSDRPPSYGWLSRLRSYFWFDPLIWLYTVVMGLISLPTSLFSNSGRIQHDLASFWSMLIMKTIFSPVRVTGLDKIDKSKPHVYAVNHASALDIPVLYYYLPFQFRIMFKKELLKYPIIGWHLKRSGQVCIDQQNKGAAVRSVRAALKSLHDGMPLVVFPEGGRTRDGQIKPFLPGAFFLAIKAQVDIVPVALIGMYELLPMDTYHIKCRPLEMRVGEPISTTGLTTHDMDALAGRVQAQLENLYYGSEAAQRL